MTDEHYAQFDMWSKWKTMGLPFSGGWAEQPAVFTDIINALEREFNKRRNSGK
jgi:hypothetical protein